ncbi:MAG: DUF2254 domain-containing protein, partial [Salinisphaeraceae bacterium]|nr:DUF2254 domain-containing protein [Salinisphaeraceae bacterium]
TATPRSFPLVIADDVSQNALSAFIGAFIFSIVGQIAVSNSYFEASGRFAIFLLILLVFAIVILTFVRWVDRIARLGRLGTIIEKVEKATLSAIGQRRRKPNLGAVPYDANQDERPDTAVQVFSPELGHVQRIDMQKLQNHAEQYECEITILAMPGQFVASNHPLAYYVINKDDADQTKVHAEIADAFLINSNRTFYEDPRFGLVVLSEIASRALSPSVNDPGTAIATLGSLLRAFDLWLKPLKETPEPVYNKLRAPATDIKEMFDDAFNGIARDGAGCIEVISRLLKVLETLSVIGDEATQAAAKHHAQRVLEQAKDALRLEQDIKAAEQAAAFITSG